MQVGCVIMGIAGHFGPLSQEEQTKVFIGEYAHRVKRGCEQWRDLCEAKGQRGRMKYTHS